MLRPYIILTDARAPHPDWPRARVPGVAVARLAVPRSARLSGAAREPSGSQSRGRRERRDGRAGLGRWDEARGVVLKGGGGRWRAVEGGGGDQPSVHRLPPPSTVFPRPSLVLRQRREHRRYLAPRAC